VRVFCTREEEVEDCKNRIIAIKEELEQNHGPIADDVFEEVIQRLYSKHGRIPDIRKRKHPSDWQVIAKLFPKKIVNKLRAIVKELHRKAAK
jgi:hypothetical protein